MSQTPVPAWMVDEVMIRDGHRCCACGVHVVRYRTARGRRRPDAAEMDHIVPESRRGMTTVDNLQTLCRACHQAKGQRTLDYRASAPSRPPSPRSLAVRRELLRGLVALVMLAAIIGLAWYALTGGIATLLE